MPKKKPCQTATPQQDIRSFFKQKSAPKEKPVTKLDLSDDDVIPESPDVHIATKKKQARKRQVVDDSSDEEIFTSKKKKSSNDKKDKTEISNGKTSEKAHLKEVKPSDLFGKGPIKRTEPIVKKEKKDLKTEIGIHNDEDFEKSLLEIDNIESEALNGIQDAKKCETKSNHHGKSNGDVTKVDKITKPNKSSEKISENAHTEKEKKDKSSNGRCNSDTDKNKKLKDQISGKKSSEEKSTLSDNPILKKEKNNVLTSPEEERKVNNEKSKEPTDNKKEPDDNTVVNKESESKEDIQPPKPEKYKIPKKPSTESTKHNDTNTKEENKNSSKKKQDDKVSKMAKSKRAFSEFVGEDEGTQNHDTDHSEEAPKSKKNKLNSTLNNSVVSDEERYEKKRHSAILYQNYLNRTGPKNPGSKEIPEGTANCLKDCAFLLTGVLESFERDEIAEAITKYGGTVKSGISRKVTHVLAGEEAGPAKIAKAEELGIKIINEDEFLKLIVDLSNKDAPKKVEKGKHDKVNKKDKTSPDNEKKTESSKKKTKASEEALKNFEEKVKKNFYPKAKETIKIESSPEKEMEPSTSKSSETKQKIDDVKRTDSNISSSSSVADIKSEHSSSSIAGNSQMWVEKYKPQNIKQIIGQHGDSSNVKKLMNWLTRWYVNRKEKLSKPSPWAKNDDGAFYKAALLSGPPGVGKTTTVSLVCKELGFDAVEFNASDTRNKTLIKGQIGELLTTNSLSGYARGDTGKQAVSKKHVLVMDEVDGMAGNEDRGGLQELISLIKTTAVPIICMCNDRNSEKMRTLVNYCYDLKFQRPRVPQIMSAMLSVCCKEGIKIPTEALTQLIVASNQDVRQTLNSLSMWAIDPALLDADGLKKDAQNKKKDLKMGPWEAIRKVFSAEDHKTMSIHDKSDLFFADYSLAPLFVQENYLHVQPHCPKHEVLERLSQAADSISLGDTVEARIRGQQAWSLLPLQAMYSSVIPGAALSGHVAAQVQFPAWLGKNSRHNKMKRLAHEIHAHTRLSATASKSSIFLDYARALRDSIVTPLVRDKAEGIPAAIDLLTSYHLTREDLDSLAELATWPGQRDPMVLVDSKVKAAMTRAYNKQAPALPHAAPSFSKSKRDRDADSQYTETEDDVEAEEDSEPENDAMIKVKKKSAPKSKESEKPSTSKGDKAKKGKGKK
ncbi:unnamed protein product [Plutella xylostella]|uniref:Replication factor C subunit 1 n=1 Tax=Plutella xylostella TaxID=51655 RepID=A0A8S4G5Q8_PLUXY|nr:unnamed protein product [Plutella xylostella]